MIHLISIWLYCNLGNFFKLLFYSLLFLEWTLEELTSQVFIFFAAGFETSASMIVMCIHELVLSPEIQERLYHEIRSFKEQHEQLTSDNLPELKYLDCVVNGTLGFLPGSSYRFLVWDHRSTNYGYIRIGWIHIIIFTLLLYFSFCTKGLYILLYQLSETLRKWSPALILDRVCVKTYELPPPRDGGKAYVVSIFIVYLFYIIMLVLAK